MGHHIESEREGPYRIGHVPHEKDTEAEKCQADLHAHCFMSESEVTLCCRESCVPLRVLGTEVLPHRLLSTHAGLQPVMNRTAWTGKSFKYEQPKKMQGP